MLPTINKILYATDLSVNALPALGYAAVMADHHQARLTVLHVMPDSLELYSEQAGLDLAETFGETAAHWINAGDRDNAAKAIRDRLQTLSKEHFDSADTPSHLAHSDIKVVCGDAGQRILAEARDGAYDLVIMGTHGQGGLLGMLLGSVAQDVVKHSTVPTLVVPLPKQV